MELNNNVSKLTKKAAYKQNACQLQKKIEFDNNGSLKI